MQLHLQPIARISLVAVAVVKLMLVQQQAVVVEGVVVWAVYYQTVKRRVNINGH
jgi:hypothetical protein